MNEKISQQLRPLVLKAMDQESGYDMALDHIRYELIRTLQPYQFQCFFQRNLVEQTPFDVQVDEMILARLKINEQNNP